MITSTQRAEQNKMSKQEIIERVKMATEMLKTDLAKEAPDSLDDYWSGSAVQSYCCAVESGNVRTVKA